MGREHLHGTPNSRVDKSDRILTTEESVSVISCCACIAIRVSHGCEAFSIRLLSAVQLSVSQLYYEYVPVGP